MYIIVFALLRGQVNMVFLKKKKKKFKIGQIHEVVRV